ncbi:MAG: cytochrome b, partial [Gammaproteobacteria bacterium]
PLWYFAPFYAILRAVPDKLMGVMAMGGAIGVMFLLPWLDRSKVRSIRYRGPLTKIAVTLFVIAFLVLGALGTMPAGDVETLIARICSVIYFGFFLLMPIYTSIENTLPEPDRVTTK